MTGIKATKLAEKKEGVREDSREEINLELKKMLIDQEREIHMKEENGITGKGLMITKDMIEETDMTREIAMTRAVEIKDAMIEVTDREEIVRIATEKGSLIKGERGR